MTDKLLTEVFSKRDDNIDLERLDEEVSRVGSEHCDHPCGLAEDVLAASRVIEKRTGSASIDLFNCDEDFEEFDFDMSVSGDCGTIEVREDKDGIPCNFTGLLNDGTYLDKILSEMVKLERWVYFREIERYSKPRTLVGLLQCLMNLRDRVNTIPASLRNAVYLCVYTEFYEVIKKHEIDRESYYRIYYEHMFEIGDSSLFLFSIEQSMSKLFEDANKDAEMTEWLQLAIRVMLFNLRKVS